MAAASAHEAPATHPRIQLAAVVGDDPTLAEQSAALAPPPPPPPPPPPAPRPPKPVVVVHVPYNLEAVAAIIRAAAARYGADPNQLIRVAMCETGLDPGDYNKRSGATGLFQFMPGTFFGHGGHNIWDATDQADIAAKMFSQGLAYEWTCK